MAKEEVGPTPEYRDALDAVEKTGKMTPREVALYGLAVRSASELFLDILNTHIDAARKAREEAVAKLEKRNQELTSLINGLQTVQQNQQHQMDSHRGHLGRLQSVVDKTTPRQSSDNAPPWPGKTK